MFDSHELVYTHDSKTGQYSGGGYILKSELLTGGAPALIALSGGGRKNRRRNNESDSGSGSGTESDGSSSTNKTNPKVSSIISNNHSIVIPAGLFLIHGPVRNENDDTTSSAFTTTNSKLRSFLYKSDSDDALSDSGDSDDSGKGRIARRDNNVISDDIYTALFKMLSPNESDKKRYWVGSAVTCKRRHQKPASASASASHKTTRKHKK
jgi:hypothetical protein